MKRISVAMTHTVTKSIILTDRTSTPKILSLKFEAHYIHIELIRQEKISKFCTNYGDAGLV